MLRISLAWICACCVFTGAALPAMAEGPTEGMSSWDRFVLERGEYTPNERINSGILGTAIGFGLGHASQDRWTRTGWIYTLGEGLGLGTVIGGAAGCDSSATPHCGYIMLGGAGLMLLFHVPEVIDVWSYPAKHNRRYHRLPKTKETDELSRNWSFGAGPNADGGGTAYVMFRF